MSTQGLQDPKQLIKLAKVIQTRVRRAEMLLQASLVKLREIECEIEERQAKVTVLENDVVNVMQFLSFDRRADTPVDTSVNSSELASQHQLTDGSVDSLQVSTAQVSTEMSAVDYQLGLKRRYWSDYDRQKEQYYLDMTHDEHKEQVKVVADARTTYVGLKNKFELMQKNLKVSQLKNNSKRQARQDSEQQSSGFNRSQGMGISS